MVRCRTSHLVVLPKPSADECSEGTAEIRSSSNSQLTNLIWQATFTGIFSGLVKAASTSSLQKRQDDDDDPTTLPSELSILTVKKLEPRFTQPSTTESSLCTDFFHQTSEVEKRQKRTARIYPHSEPSLNRRRLPIVTKRSPLETVITTQTEGSPPAASFSSTATEFMTPGAAYGNVSSLPTPTITPPPQTYQDESDGDYTWMEIYDGPQTTAVNMLEGNVNDPDEPQTLVMEEYGPQSSMIVVGKGKFKDEPEEPNADELEYPDADELEYPDADEPDDLGFPSQGPFTIAGAAALPSATGAALLVGGGDGAFTLVAAETNPTSTALVMMEGDQDGQLGFNETPLSVTADDLHNQSKRDLSDDSEANDCEADDPETGTATETTTSPPTTLSLYATSETPTEHVDMTVTLRGESDKDRPQTGAGSVGMTPFVNIAAGTLLAAFMVVLFVL